MEYQERSESSHGEKHLPINAFKVTQNVSLVTFHLRTQKLQIGNVLRNSLVQHFKVKDDHIFPLNKKMNEYISLCMVVAGYVAGYEQWCANSDPMIAVNVLHLFHNISPGYTWCKFIAETMYNLSSTKLLLLVVDTKWASRIKH